MSSQIQNILFRFVTLRAPELADEKTKNINFIVRPNGLTTVFDAAVAARTGTKWAAMVAEAVRFLDSSLPNHIAPLSLADLRDDMEATLDFGIWLSKNRNSATNEEIRSKADELSETNPPFIALVTLWENLFFQIVSQTDFYVKEGLIQCLLGLHVLGVFERGGQENVLAAANAKVVLPKKLFTEDAVTSGNVSPVSTPVKSGPTPSCCEKPTGTKPLIVWAD